MGLDKLIWNRPPKEAPQWDPETMSSYMIDLDEEEAVTIAAMEAGIEGKNIQFRYPREWVWNPNESKWQKVEKGRLCVKVIGSAENRAQFLKNFKKTRRPVSF